MRNFIKMNKIKKPQKTPINPPTIYSGNVPAKISAGLRDFYRTARIFTTIRNISETAIDSWIGFIFSGRVGRFYVGSFKIYFMNKNNFPL